MAVHTYSLIRMGKTEILKTNFKNVKWKVKIVKENVKAKEFCTIHYHLWQVTWENTKYVKKRAKNDKNTGVKKLKL